MLVGLNVNFQMLVVQSKNGHRMGGGTFFKVGGTSASQKPIENFVAWIGNCDVTSIDIWRH